MADLKITALGANTTPVSTDIFPMVDDPSGVPVTQKMTLATLDTHLSATTKTLTNKTLTSPKLNEAVVLTATATQLNNLNLATNDGWISANETWTYASASTITVPTGAASKYQKGDRIKWTQTTVKYGVIVGVADTVLTIAVNTNHVVTNAAITLNYYSHQANPIGYPHSFTFDSTIVGFSGTPTQIIKYSILGNICTINQSISGTSNAINFTYTIPVVSAGNLFYPMRATDNGTVGANPGLLAFSGASASVIAYLTFIPNTWTNSGAKGFGGCIYKIRF